MRPSNLTSMPPSASDEVSSIETAGNILRAELLKPEAHKIWAQYLPSMISESTDVMSYRAISRAIAHHLHQRYGMDEAPSRYKDRVRRAVLGQSLTPDTLELFADSFNLPTQTVEEISSLIVRNDTRVPYKDLPRRNHRYQPTSSFYDIYFDENLQATQIICSMILRSVDDYVDTLWAGHSEDIKHIEVIEGGTSSWDEAHQAWKFKLDYLLAPRESIPLRYVIDINQNLEQEGLISLAYGVSRSACFYRLFFASSETAPEAIELARIPTDGQGAENSPTEKIQVFEKRASLYLDTVDKEKLLFSAAKS